MDKRIELLAPAGNFEKLKTAFRFGADAAYLGGKDFSLRSFADNFSAEELRAATLLPLPTISAICRKSARARRW